MTERLLTALAILELQIDRSCEQRRLRSMVRVGRALIDAGDPERALHILAEGTEFLARCRCHTAGERPRRSAWRC